MASAQEGQMTALSSKRVVARATVRHNAPALTDLVLMMVSPREGPFRMCGFMGESPNRPIALESRVALSNPHDGTPPATRWLSAQSATLFPVCLGITRVSLSPVPAGLFQSQVPGPLPVSGTDLFMDLTEVRDILVQLQVKLF